MLKKMLQFRCFFSVLYYKLCYSIPFAEELRCLESKDFGNVVKKSKKNNLHSNFFCKPAPDTLSSESHFLKISNHSLEEYTAHFMDISQFSQQTISCIAAIIPIVTCLMSSLLKLTLRTREVLLLSCQKMEAIAHNYCNNNRTLTLNFKIINKNI